MYLLISVVQYDTKVIMHRKFKLLYLQTLIQPKTMSSVSALSCTGLLTMVDLIQQNKGFYCEAFNKNDNMSTLSMRYM